MPFLEILHPFLRAGQRGAVYKFRKS